MGTMIREYETLFILNPELGDDQVKEIVERLKGVIAKNEGQMLREDLWGRKKLAYYIEKHSRGYYTNLHFVGPAIVHDELERTLRNIEHVIRFISTGHGRCTDIEARRVEVEKQARERAERVRNEAAFEERERGGGGGGGGDHHDDMMMQDEDRASIPAE